MFQKGSMSWMYTESTMELDRIPTNLLASICNQLLRGAEHFRNLNCRDSNRMWNVKPIMDWPLYRKDGFYRTQKLVLVRHNNLRRSTSVATNERHFGLQFRTACAMCNRTLAQRGFLSKEPILDWTCKEGMETHHAVRRRICLVS